MAKSKLADNQFTPNERFLARIISARLASHPTVDPKDSGLMVEVKLSVLCSLPAKSTPKFYGYQAVVYIPVYKVQDQLIAKGKGAEFLSKFDITLPSPINAGPGPLIKQSRWLVCTFGEADLIHKFQSITTSEIADDAFSRQVIDQSLEASSRKVPGLEFPEKYIVSRCRLKPVSLQELEWTVLKTLADHYPAPLDTSRLRKIWEDLGKADPEENTVQKLISRLNPKVEELQIKVQATHTKAYRLVDLKHG